jgi:hypothetical protein
VTLCSDADLLETKSEDRVDLLESIIAHLFLHKLRVVLIVDEPAITAEESGNVLIELNFDVSDTNKRHRRLDLLLKYFVVNNVDWNFVKLVLQVPAYLNVAKGFAIARIQLGVHE